MKQQIEVKDRKLTPHFRLSEFTKSATARRLRISNQPTEEAVENLENLCNEILEPLRRQFGPIHINSGYRCPQLNEAVGGVGNSSHLRGEAADIRLRDTETGRAYYVFLLTHTDFDQLLFEHNRKGGQWLHVSCRKARGSNRHQAFPNYRVE